VFLIFLNCYAFFFKDFYAIVRDENENAAMMVEYVSAEARALREELTRQRVNEPVVTNTVEKGEHEEIEC
jgi:hypothetical protein